MNILSPEDCIKKVFETLGYGYKEHIYQNALCIELRNNLYTFHNEVIVPIYYENIQIGYERADIIIYKPEKCILELKAQNTLTKKDAMQLKKYLINTEIQKGLLVNFGSEELNIQQITL